MRDYNLWTWENVIEAAKANGFIDAVLGCMEVDNLDRELALIGMVLLQDAALKDIENLQEKGWQYGEHAGRSLHASMGINDPFLSEAIKAKRARFDEFEEE